MDQNRGDRESVGCRLLCKMLTNTVLTCSHNVVYRGVVGEVLLRDKLIIR